MTSLARQLSEVPEVYRHLIPDHGKSPWQPSAKATARVPDPVAVPKACPYCQGPIQIHHHTEIYRQTYGEWPWVYGCLPCDAHVGMHPFTAIPLGTIANRGLRNVRKACKQPFELLWQHKRMTRTDAYAALAKHLGIEAAECHFGLFDEQRSKAARAWAVTALREH